MKDRGRWGVRLWTTMTTVCAVGALLWMGVWGAEGIVFPRVNEFFRGGFAFVGALLLMVTGTSLFLRFTGRRRQNLFEIYNDAILRITEGDFEAKIPLEAQSDRGPWEEFQELGKNLNTMADTLARMEGLRRQFVADVSHEFQSPLTSILGFAEALKADLPPGTRTRYLQIIEEEARRLSRLSANLLKLSALEDQDGPPEPEAFRLDAQLRRVVVALEPQWTARGLTVEADVTEATFVGNEELWTQAWTNLLHNAIKFTPTGGRIVVRLSSGPLVVEIEDTGIGLTPDQASRVFERFYKADAARSVSDAGGSGLGLALVHRIATLHRARVEALSPGLGQGTTLRVTFPRNF